MEITFNSDHQNRSFANGKLEVELLISDSGSLKSDSIYFTVPPDFRTHNDLVASTLATLCGKKYDVITFNFPISDFCKNILKDYCTTEINTPPGLVEEFVPGKGLFLNFSGGFDSLAMRYMLEGNAKLIAVDFGGWYKRETDFFSKLQVDYICKTDFREKKYDANSWTFMGAPSILFAQYANCGAVTFGTVMESEDNTIYRSTEFERPPIWRAPFSASRLEYVGIVLGITEFGTAMMADHAYPELIEASLKSLSHVGSEKLFRKAILIELVRARKNNRKPVLSNLPPFPTSRTRFGKLITVDFLAIYFASKFGADYVANWMDGIENVDLSVTSKLPLDFYFRFNTNYYGSIPAAVRPTVMSRMQASGIQPYTEADWIALDAVRTVLRQTRLVAK